MKMKILIVLMLLIGISCTSPNREDQPKQETPEALKDENEYVKMSLRGGEDLVEELYNEMAQKDADLKKLEEELKELRSSYNDSMKTFTKFDGRSQDYYTLAGNYTEQIKDSVLRVKISKIISGSMEKYASLTSKHEELLKNIDTQNNTLADLHTVLKIIKTLHVMEKYQRDELPSSRPLEGYKSKQDKVINLLDSLSK